jgi:nucleoside-diphosphate-sugar epimerase
MGDLLDRRVPKAREVMSAITVVGARGFIGSHLVRELEVQGREVQSLGRGEVARGPLGTVVYCAGVTADFRVHPYRAVGAHVVDLIPLLESGEFERLVYLSSTRVYGLAPAETSEDAALTVRPITPDHLYNASKIMGESLIATSRRTAHVLRLSNVFGVDTAAGSFLSQIASAALNEGRITLRSALTSEKDYVGINDVVRAILAVVDGRAPEPVYNVAAGANTSHREIVEALAALTGARVEVAADAPAVVFPPIRVERLRNHVEWAPNSLLEHLPELVAGYRAVGRT